ncbi:MAG TPA: FAD-dependent oxidoreductase [Mycobacteriales bacterium]
MPDLRVAVIGSGPAGVYAAGALLRAGHVSIDVFDRLPAPYGLVRYGVAPDHVKMKSVDVALAKILQDPAVRFLGNVEAGTDVTLTELRRYYDAVVYATGAAVDRRLGVPGEDLAGSFSATDFVAWYSGHPDAELDRFTLGARRVVVIGVGNVAVDVVRVLAKTAADLSPTDVPRHVLDVLDASAVEDITMVGRRGPAQAKFTTKELRELGELANADVVVDPADLELTAEDEELLAADRTVRANVGVLRDWAERTPEGRPRTIRLRFRLRPAELLGGGAANGSGGGAAQGCGVDAVTGVRFERMSADLAPTGETVDLPAEMVLRSVGYRALPVPGLPFDERAAVVPHDAGRVRSRTGPVPGLYVAGWIKRGPTGVIGTNKSDAVETVATLLADAEAGQVPRAPVRDPDALVQFLRARGIHPVEWSGWESIDEAERELGAARGCPRVKIADRETLLATARSPLGSRVAG